MHERSLVRALIAQVAELANEHRARRVAEVRVRVGPLSGVEPLLLTSAFEELAVGELFDDARLALVEVELCASCRDCGAQFPVVEFHFRCHECGSRNIQTTDGDALILESVAFAVANEGEPLHDHGH